MEGSSVQPRLPFDNPILPAPPGVHKAISNGKRQMAKFKWIHICHLKLLSERFKEL
jgi:hypothetical protein